MRAHSDIRTGPGGVFAGARSGLCVCFRLVSDRSVTVGRPARLCPSVVASTASPRLPPRRLPPLPPLRPVPGSAVCRLELDVWDGSLLSVMMWLIIGRMHPDGM